MKVCVYVSVYLRLRQRAFSSCAIGRVQEARGLKGEGWSTAGRPAGSLHYMSSVGSCNYTRTHTHTRLQCSNCCCYWGQPYMALGFPWKETRIVEEGEKCLQDSNCMHRLGFCSEASTIASLESQVCFHVRGLKARAGNGRGEVEVR